MGQVLQVQSVSDPANASFCLGTPALDVGVNGEVVSVHRSVELHFVGGAALMVEGVKGANHVSSQSRVAHLPVSHRACVDELLDAEDIALVDQGRSEVAFGHGGEEEFFNGQIDDLVFEFSVEQDPVLFISQGH